MAPRPVVDLTPDKVDNCLGWQTFEVDGFGLKLYFKMTWL